MTDDQIERMIQAVERVAAALERKGPPTITGMTGISPASTGKNTSKRAGGLKAAAVVQRGPGGRFVGRPTGNAPASTGILPAAPASDGVSVAQVASQNRASAGAVVVAAGRQPGQASVSLVIAAYITAWQARYQTKARPEVTKCIGVFRALLKERPVDELVSLVQVYCQMEDPWFVTKHHDIGTFASNIGKVALALDKGHERPRGEKHWTEIYEERTRDDGQ